MLTWYTRPPPLVFALLHLLILTFVVRLLSLVRRLESEKHSAAEGVRMEYEREVEEVKQQCREEVERVRI